MADTPTFKTEALRLVSNVQLVKQLLPCNEQQIQHYLFFGSNSRRALLLRPRPSILSIASAIQLKSSRACFLIGYSDFILCEWFLIAWGQTHKQTRISTSRTKAISRNQVCGPK